MKAQGNILAFDTSTGTGSVALLSDGKITVRALNTPNKQASELVPAIESVMTEAGIWYGDLVKIVTTRGPGSFTGIRIGLSVAQTLQFAGKLPVATLTTLETLAWAAASQGLDKIVATLRAGRGDIYVQRFAFSNGKPVAESKIEILSPDQWEIYLGLDMPLAGNTASLLPEMFHARFIAGCELPDARALLAAADDTALETEPLAPLYIRPPDAKISVKTL